MAKGTDKQRKTVHKVLANTKAGVKSNPKPPVKKIELKAVTASNVSLVLLPFGGKEIKIEAGFDTSIIIRAKVVKGTYKPAVNALVRNFGPNITAVINS